MLPILTLLLALTFSISGDQQTSVTAPGDLETPTSNVAGDLETPAVTAEKPVNDGGCDPKCTYGDATEIAGSFEMPRLASIGQELREDVGRAAIRPGVRDGNEFGGGVGKLKEALASLVIQFPAGHCGTGIAIQKSPRNELELMCFVGW